jgi:prophage tail gpP-like protein
MAEVVPLRAISPPRLVEASKEIATLRVRGSLFTNWTTVRIEQKVTEAFPVFQFECTEESPMPLIYSALQFIPGDVVTAYVGGVPVIFGYINERHVAYDATNHAVRLIGVGDSYDLTTSMVPLEKLGGHDGKSVLQIAKDLAQHLGVEIIPRGAVDLMPFDNVQVQPGETPMQVIERYARMRNIVIGSNATGGLLLIGENPAVSTGNLTEGDNILRANCTVRDGMVYRRILAVGQSTGSDAASGDSQNKQVAETYGTSTRNRIMITVADIADTMHGIQRRAMMEKVFTEGSKIEAQITVQGWFKDNNKSADIWKAGEYYFVDSPSLILHEILGCASCVYEQTDGGTLTTMTLVKPIHMNGRFNVRQEALELLAQQRAEEAARRKALQDATWLENLGR